MTIFRDFLVWYNNLDVGPFVTAVENLQRYFFKRNIDIFKISISVPGLARHMLFESGRSVALLDEKNKDLYYTIKRNIGGPSIIFNRHHEEGKTFIRNYISKPCQKIVGVDANAISTALVRPCPRNLLRVAVWRMTSNLRKPKSISWHMTGWTGPVNVWVAPSNIN